MSDGSSIEWLNWPGYRPASWNPVRGCTNVSEGCRRCYARIMAARFSKPGQWGHGIAEMRGGDHRWTGRVEMDDAKLLLPLRWRAPRCIFVNSTSDLFHERLPDEAIDRVFAVMALCPQHRFIVLTKRSERMMERLSLLSLPLPNVILGVSVEDRSAMHRIDDLRATPAACRMISCEPLLEDLGQIDLAGISWCVVGGESGAGARPMHPDWARSVRDQCRDVGVAYFHKQNGEWAPGVSCSMPRAAVHDFGDSYVHRVGKHRAGRLLDGREWTQLPEVTR